MDVGNFVIGVVGKLKIKKFYLKLVKKNLIKNFFCINTKLFFIINEIKISRLNIIKNKLFILMNYII